MSNERLHALVERISNLLREDLRKVATAHNLALAQLEVLQFLSVANGYSDNLSAVVNYMGATKGTMSQTLRALERKGLIVREKDNEDARKVHCRPTDAGREVVEQARPAPVLRKVNGSDSVLALESLLTELLAVRGAAPFGVCNTCGYHQIRTNGAWCALAEAPIAPVDVEKLCQEYKPAA